MFYTQNRLTWSPVANRGSGVLRFILSYITAYDEHVTIDALSVSGDILRGKTEPVIYYNGVLHKAKDTDRPNDALAWFNSTTEQSDRSPKIVAFFSATNFSSYIIELLQLQDAIQIKWNYAWIHYNIAKRSHLMI